MLSNYPKLSSAIHTFLATFIVTLAGAIALIPADQITNGTTWTTAFIVGLITSAVRAGIKQISPLS